MVQARRSSNKENAFSKTLLLGKGSSAAADPKVAKRRVRSHIVCVVPASVPADSVGSALGAFVDSQLDGLCESFVSGPVDKAAPRKLNLPRQLRRPIYRAINPAALNAVDPVLSKVPAEYVQQKLRCVGDKLYAAATNIQARWPEGKIMQHLNVSINDTPTSDVPSHLFAVYSDPSKRRILLYPAHSIIFAAQCANLPPLPSIPQVIVGDRASLPVLPLRIPSLKTFPLVQHYLYTHRIDRLLLSLLPIYQKSTNSMELSTDLANSNTALGLIALLSVVHGLWSNVAALGIFDEALWSAIDYAWTILITALEAKIGEDSCQVEKTV